jgi:hypothetical protein
MELSDLLSVFALIISLASIYIAWRAYQRDNPDLRVSLDYWPQDDEESCFNVRTINHGRRVAFVERIIVNFKNGPPLQSSIAGGRPVTESEPFDFQLYIYSLNGVPHHIPTEVKSAEVFDTLGRRYGFPALSLKDWLKFRQLQAKIRRLWRDEQTSRAEETPS